CFPALLGRAVTLARVQPPAATVVRPSASVTAARTLPCSGSEVSWPHAEVPATPASATARYAAFESGCCFGKENRPFAPDVAVSMTVHVAEPAGLRCRSTVRPATHGASAMIAP